MERQAVYGPAKPELSPATERALGAFVRDDRHGSVRLQTFATPVSHAATPVQ